MNSKKNRTDVFILEYLKDFNATRAGIAAGYSKRTAHSQASRLLKTVKCQEAIARHKANITAEVIVNRETMTKQFDEDRAFAIKHKSPSALVSASTAKAKLHGLFVDKKEIVFPPLEGMTDEQLDELIASEIAKLPADKLKELVAKAQETKKEG